MYLILRPKSKLADSVECFHKAGLTAVGCGLIETIALPNARSILSTLGATKPNIIIVTSTVAADIYVDSLSGQSNSMAALSNRFPANTVFIAVGASTAKKLKLPHPSVMQAQPASSEGILTLVRQLKLSPANVAILKGKGGLKLINESLSALGFQVTEYDLYERQVLSSPFYTSRFEADDIQCIIATSTEIIDAAYNFFEPDWLNQRQWIVVSDRGRLHLSALGATNIITSNGATDSHLTAAANQVKGSQNE